jgi:hypothetical protein
MNFQAADNIVGIDAVLTGRSTEHIVVGHSPVLKSDDGSRGGDCQSGDITARFRNIIKAEPAAHYFVGQRSKRGAPYGVSCGREVSKAYPPARSYNPCPTGAVTMATRALKVRPHRSRQNKGAASLTKAPSAFRKISEAVNRQGTLTITGSNVHRGTEMPVALSLF